MGKLVAVHVAADTPAALSDEALLAGVATGDTAALAALYRRHHAALYRFLSRLAGVDSRDLDDLVQAAFIAVHGAAASFAGTSTVKTWIYGIAINVVGKHVRTEVRRRAKHARLVEIPADAPVGPASLAEHRELLARLRDALANLSHELRSVFVLCVVEGVSGREAAAVLGIREGTLWRRLHDARTELRHALEGTR